MNLPSGFCLAQLGTRDESRPSLNKEGGCYDKRESFCRRHTRKGSHQAD